MRSVRRSRSRGLRSAPPRCVRSWPKRASPRCHVASTTSAPPASVRRSSPSPMCAALRSPHVNFLRVSAGSSSLSQI
jgi:hypothetical protein